MATLEGTELVLRHTGNAWDIYRISASIEGSGWSVRLANALAAMPEGWTSRIPLHVTRGTGPATLTVTATSESDPLKMSTAKTTLTGR